MIFIIIVGIWLTIFLLFGGCSELYRKKWNTDYPKMSETDLLFMAAFFLCFSCTLVILFVFGFYTAFFDISKFGDSILYDYNPILSLPFAIIACVIPFIIWGLFTVGFFLLLYCIIYPIEKFYNFIMNKIF